MCAHVCVCVHVSIYIFQGHYKVTFFPQSNHVFSGLAVPFGPEISSLPHHVLLPLLPRVVIKGSVIVSFRLRSPALTQLTAALTHLHEEVCLFSLSSGQPSDCGEA